MELYLSLNDKQSQQLKLMSTIKDVSMNQYVETVLSEHFDNIKSSDIISELQNIFSTDDSETVETVGKQSRHNNATSNEFIIPKSFHKPFANVVLSRCDFVNHGIRKKQKLRFNLNHALYIKEKGSSFGYDDFTDMIDKFGSSQAVLYRFVWNVQQGNFDGLIEQFYKPMDSVQFSKKNGNLYINDEKVSDIYSIRILTHQFVNKNGGKHEKVLELIRKNPHLDKLHVRILCENIDNQKLMELLQNNKKTEVVNNREKRQNLLMNGGI